MQFNARIIRASCWNESASEQPSGKQRTGARKEMARTEILAAGGIVVRSGRVPLIAVVQRRKDDWWVLPKGKLKRNESVLAAAKREVVEETGVDVSVQEFIGAISYEVGGGPKLVQFWRMQMIDGATRELMDDIKAVEWLPLRAAIERLDHPVEQAFLRGVGHRAIVQRVQPERRARVAREPVVAQKATRKKIARTKVAARKRRIPQVEIAATHADTESFTPVVFAQPVEELRDFDLTIANETVAMPPELEADLSNRGKPNLVQRLMRRVMRQGDDKHPDVRH